MSKYQVLIDALNGDDSLFSNVRNGDVRVLLADLERAEKALAALAQQAQEPVANDRDCPHCNYTGSMHCGDVAKTHGGILNPEDCSHAKLFGSRITAPPAPQPAPVDDLPDLNPEDVVVDVVLKQLGGFAPVTAHGVRVTHKPSRISVVVDSERSQHRNRQLALEALRAILAMRPAVEPMTLEEMRKAAMDEMSKIPALANHHSWKGWPGTWAFATAAVNGITAKAEGGV